jgi:integrase
VACVHLTRFRLALTGKLRRGYTSFWEKLGRGCQDAAIKHVSPHSFRHNYRAWLDELGTPTTVQQRAMRHGEIRVSINYSDALGDGLREASAKVAAKLNGNNGTGEHLSH